MQRLVDRPQPRLQLLRGDNHGRQLVADGIEEDTRIVHVGPSTRRVKSFIW